jgi:asparaginyl-tRNA synthetase
MSRHYSNTTRHLAEFHMVEPELAFADLQVRSLRSFLICHVILSLPQDAMSNAESYIKFVVKAVLEVLSPVPSNP